MTNSEFNKLWLIARRVKEYASQEAAVYGVDLNRTDLDKIEHDTAITVWTCLKRTKQNSQAAIIHAAGNGAAVCGTVNHTERITNDCRIVDCAVCLAVMKEKGGMP